MKCPECGCDIESRAHKNIRVAWEDTKAGLYVLTHPKKLIEKKEYPRDCKRRCPNVGKDPEV
jgi:hypothetical protein